jgi:prevent-host-death family protein
MQSKLSIDSHYVHNIYEVVIMRRSMKEISSKEAREQMADILNRVAYGGKRYMLTRHGTGVAVIISLEEWEAIEKFLQKMEDEEDVQDAEEAMERIKKGETTISHKKLKKKLGL